MDAFSCLGVWPWKAEGALSLPFREWKARVLRGSFGVESSQAASVSLSSRQGRGLKAPEKGELAVVLLGLSSPPPAAVLDLGFACIRTAWLSKGTTACSVDLVSQFSYMGLFVCCIAELRFSVKHGGSTSTIKAWCSQKWDRT